MNIRKAKFYEYPVMGLDEGSVMRSEIINSQYLQETNTLAAAHGIALHPLLGSYKDRLYPILLPLNTEDRKLLAAFAEIASRSYNSAPVALPPEQYDTLEENRHTDALRAFLNEFGQG